jgi:hypothetical protein
MARVGERAIDLAIRPEPLISWRHGVPETGARAHVPLSETAGALSNAVVGSSDGARHAALASTAFAEMPFATEATTVAILRALSLSEWASAAFARSSRAIAQVPPNLTWASDGNAFRASRF